jgi:hypothetical protein
MTTTSALRALVSSPDEWESTEPPQGAHVAFVRVRNKREMRLQKTSPGGLQDTVAEGEAGTIVALRIDPSGGAEFWTSRTNADAKTKRIYAAGNVRKRFRSFASLVAEADANASITHSED